MHVKYASRHALYPEPNVFEPAAVAVINAARDRRDVAPDLVAERDVPAVVGVVAARVRDAERDVFCLVAVRVVVLPAFVRDVVPRVVCAVDAVRDVVDVWAAWVRDVVARDVDVFVVLPPRDVTVVVPRDDCVVFDAERTAALAKPMPPTSTAIKITMRFIISYIMISKMKPPGNAYLRQSVIKNPATRDRIYCLFAVWSGVGRLRSTNVMRPLSKSYGVISTRTFSPTLTHMRALRILPHTVAKISCPFSNFTRNIVFGNLSSTVPVKTITSSFAMVKYSF